MIIILGLGFAVCLFFAIQYGAGPIFMAGIILGVLFALDFKQKE